MLVGTGVSRGTLLTLVMGCSLATPNAEADLCAEVSEHVAACVGAPSPTPTDCDREAASELLELPCDAINDGKADTFASALCAIGLLRHCPVTTCAEALPPDQEFQDLDCAALIDLEGCAACDYYRCREAQSIGQCGGAGYYIGFGYKYCLRYAQVTEPRMSIDGQAWNAAARACLVESLDTNVPDSTDCQAIVEAGYATHAQCYAQTGFCELSLSDASRIVSTIDTEDADFSQALEIGLDCLSD